MEGAIGMSASEMGSSGWRGTDEGDKLKSQDGWSEDGDGDDEFDFGGLAAGHRHYSGNYFDASGLSAVYWTSTAPDVDRAWFRVLNYSESRIQRTRDFKSYGMSIRCIKDSE